MRLLLPIAKVLPSSGLKVANMFSSTTYTSEKTRIKPERMQQKRVANIELEGGINFIVTDASLPLQIGRELDCDITIPRGYVSRHHCQLYVSNGELFLKDTSSNGTLVGKHSVKGNAVKIKKRTTVIVAGDAKLIITPMNELEPSKNRRNAYERRVEERRAEERRQEDIIVPFNQRKSMRRENERREMQRR